MVKKSDNLLSPRVPLMEDGVLFGICESFIIAQITFWSKQCKRTPEEGMFRTLKDWVIDLPIYGRTTIHNSLKNLENLGIVTITHDPKSRHNQRVWYGLNTTKLCEQRATLSLPRVNNKDTSHMKDIYSHSIEDSQLYRLANLLCQNVAHKTLDEFELVCQNMNAECQNVAYNPDLLLIYITKTTQRVISENLIDGVLTFDGFWKVFRKLTNRKNLPAKSKTALRWKSFSQAKRDRFITRLADHLLDVHLSNDYVFWDPPSNEDLRTCGLSSTSDTSFVNKWILPEHPYGDTQQEIEEYYDDKLYTKLKPKKPTGKLGSTSQSTNVLDMHQKFKQLRVVHGGDPTIG